MMIPATHARRTAVEAGVFSFRYFYFSHEGVGVA
jgi:hypothetical protein